MSIEETTKPANRLQRRLFVFGVFLGIIALATSCAPNPQKKIIGKWHSSTDTNAVIRFVEDGSVIVEEGGKVQTGRFVFSDNNTIQIEVGDHTNSGSISFPSNDEALLVSAIGSATELLKRAK